MDTVLHLVLLPVTELRLWCHTKGPRYTYGQANDNGASDIAHGAYSSRPQPQGTYNPEVYGSYAALPVLLLVVLRVIKKLRGSINSKVLLKGDITMISNTVLPLMATTVSRLLVLVRPRLLLMQVQIQPLLLLGVSAP